MLKIYGVPTSRALGTIWTALELGIDYENVPIGWADDSIHSEAYRTINPNARVPAIEDDGFVLWESLAINLYLVRKHGGPIAPASLTEEALAWQWTLWAGTHLERALLRWGLHSAILDPEERDPAAAEAGRQEAEPLLRVLDDALGRAPFLAGDRFTVTDLNVGCAMFRTRRVLDFSGYPRLAAWDRAVGGRPAAEQAWRIREAAAKG